MKIRLKVKHLVLFVMLPLCVLTAIPLMLSSLKAGSAAPVLSEPAAVSGTEVTELLNKLESSSGMSRIELIRTNVVDPGNLHPAYWSNVYIGGTMSQWSQVVDEEAEPPLPPEDRIRLLEEYVLKGPVDHSLRNAVKQLVYEYDARGTGEEADGMLAEILKRISSKASIAKELTLLRAERAMNAGDFPAAELLLKAADSTIQYSDMELDARSALLQGRLLFVQGRSSEALSLVEDALQSYREEWGELKAQPAAGKDESQDHTQVETAVEVSSDSERQLISLQTALHSAMNMGQLSAATLEGALTRSDGTAVARAGIFLRAESEIYHSVHYDSEPHQIVTDENGHFQFSGVIPGFYQIELGLSFEQIDGWTWPVQMNDWIKIKAGDSITHDITLQPLLELKSPVNSQVLTGSSVEFKWEAVHNAAYYSLTGTVSSEKGGSFGHVIRQYITDNQVSVPVEELYNSGGFSTGSSGEGWQSTYPSSLLGFADPNSRFSWSIEAYNEEGQVITRSNGYRLNEDTVGNLPFFYLKSRTLTAADRLVADEKLEQALEAYRKDYAANPQDDHALKMMIHLLIAKHSDTRDVQVKDEAMALLEKLVHLRPDDNYLFNLVNYYFDQADWYNYNKYYSLYLAAKEQYANSYADSFHAAALMYQGQLAEARRQFSIALEEDRSHRYIGIYLAAELAAGESLSSAMNLAKRYPEHGYNHGGTYWPLLIFGLQAERVGQPEAFDKLLNEKLDIYVTGQHESLQKWTEDRDTAFPALKAFMNAVLEVS